MARLLGVYFDQLQSATSRFDKLDGDVSAGRSLLLWNCLTDGQPPVTVCYFAGKRCSSLLLIKDIWKARSSVQEALEFNTYHSLIWKITVEMLWSYTVKTTSICEWLCDSVKYLRKAIKMYVTFLPWCWLQINVQSNTLRVRLSSKLDSFHYQKQGRRKNVFMTASLILRVSFKVYNCLEGAEMDWSI